VFDPPLSQHDDKPMGDPWIWAATIIVTIVFFTMSGLFTPVANQSARHADGNVDIAQSGSTLDLEASRRVNGMMVQWMETEGRGIAPRAISGPVSGNHRQ
jgi:hypothetical protein